MKTKKYASCTLAKSMKATRPYLKSKMTRRSFLGASATTLAMFSIVPADVLGGIRHQAPSDKLTIAAVGIGGMGKNYLEGCKQERIVALCDCDTKYAEPVFARFPDAKRYNDYRIMFEKEAKNFDALIIGTPDHTHAVILMEALRHGKHIYCAKPIVHNIHEARTIREAVLKAGLITQTSAQSAGSAGARGTEEILMSGVLGPINEVHVWEPQPIYSCSQLSPKDTPPVPSGLDWDLWLGPAPYRPYHPVYAPFRWRTWWDFGSGDVGDMASHSFHVFFNVLKLGQRSPKIISGYSSQHRGQPDLKMDRTINYGKDILTNESSSDSSQVSWYFPPINNLPALNLHWYDGGMRPLRPSELDRSILMPASGILFVGEHGKMLSGFSGGNDLLLPVAKFKNFKRPKPTLPRSIGHYLEWTNGCKTNTPTSCPIDFGCRMNEIALLGAIALRSIAPPDLPRKRPTELLEWDANTMQITNNDKANAWVNPPYRNGWSL